MASCRVMPEVLVGRYRIERLLGAGGLGNVYQAKDLLAEQLGDPSPHIALKVLGEALSESPDASSLLYSEFALTRSLRHYNVVRVYSYEVDTKCKLAFITMELLKGPTLDKLLCKRPSGVPWKELQGIALPLLNALAYAHARAVLHGDIKPSNIMLSDQGVRLFDFGLGQAGQGPLAGLPQLSRDRFAAWTPGYAAPELLSGQPLSAEADVFGVACVLFELAGGKHPFGRLPSLEARARNLDRELHPPRHLPKPCWPALRTALALDLSARTMTAEQLLKVFSVAGRWRGWIRAW